MPTSEQSPAGPTAVAPVWFGDHLAEGDCWNNTFDASGDYDYSGVPVEVACAGPHDNEVYLVSVIESADGSFPGDDAIEPISHERCDAGFADYVGVSVEETALEWFTNWPEPEEWSQGGRTLVCSAYLHAPALPNEGAPVVGSARGAGTHVVPASLPEGVPIPARAVFGELIVAEDGSYVASYEMPGSVDDVLAATIAAFEQHETWRIVSSAGTADIRVLTISDGELRTSVTINQFPDGVRWWLYHPAPVEG
ncbi:MAG TPA: septum formation family protein [Candidatus Limnocylindria bacterium]|nr:septum formation family protein [Candidatus Limnocylindria bacterium]